jgi:hypothetical protein
LEAVRKRQEVKGKKHPKYEEPRFADKSPNFGVYHYAGKTIA